VPALVFATAFLVYKVPVGSTESSDDYLNQANFYYARGAYEEAAASYEKVLMIKPEFENALNNLALIYNKIGEYRKAADKLSELVKIDPENPTYHYDYATNIILDIKEKNAGTIEEIQTAIDEFKKADAIQSGFQKVKENIAFLEDMSKQYYAKIQSS
jgi:tetratricopeptide (TPR) repeat protein